MPHKPKPNIYSGITSADGMLENSAATTRIQATVNKMQSCGGKCDTLSVGHTYPNNDFPFACKDFRTGVITSLFNPDNGDVITRNELPGLDLTYSQLISLGRHRKVKKRAV